VLRWSERKGPKEPNSLVDHYSGGHGMSFCLEDQKPRLQSPQPHCWGFSFKASQLAVTVWRLPKDLTLIAWANVHFRG
jgi:hypothetical protein